MASPGLAVAGGSAALSAKSDQAGGDKRAVDLELLDAGLEMASDQGGVFGDFHVHRS